MTPGRRGFIIAACLLLAAASLSGQCPDRDLLWKRILFLRDSSRVSVDEKLKELLHYEQGMAACPYRNDSTHAFLLQRIGVMYNRKGDFVRAVEYTRQSISILTANAGRRSVNLNRLKICYNNLSIYYDSLKQETEKNGAIDSCILVSIQRKIVDSFTFTALDKRVKDLFFIGDYARCLSNADRGEMLTREYEHGKDSLNYLISFEEWKGDALLFLKDYEQAGKLLSLKLNEYKKAGIDRNWSTFYTLLAKIDMERGDLEKARTGLQTALKENRKAHDLNGCSESLDEIGFFYFDKLHRYPEALAFYKQALLYSNNADSINILNNIANIYVRQGQYETAQSYFRRALDKISPGIDERGLLGHVQEYVYNNITEYVAELLLDKADAHLQQYRVTNKRESLTDAIRIYKTTDRLLDEIREEQSELRSQLFWRLHTRRLYEHAIQASYLEGNPVDAFYFFEKSRAALLNDQLREQRWASKKDILQEAQLKKRIGQLEGVLAHAGQSSMQTIGLQNELFAGKQELEHLRGSIRAHDPLYYQSFLDTGFITLAEVQKKSLNGRQAFLELFTGDSAVYLLQITPQANYLSKINKTDFDSTVGLYDRYISDPAALNRHFGEYVQTARHLYRLLFQQYPLPDGRIIISEDGRYFPFEALVTGGSVDAPVYFLNGHAGSYTWSARYLLNDFTADPALVSGDLLGVAPIDYTASLHLASLPGSDQSLVRIASGFRRADNLIATQASRNNFLQQFSGYRIIQLYTHAADSSSSGEPAIYFSDSVLYLPDLISGNRPVADLVVLSACETATGKLYEGEGVFSFSRGFAALGIPSSISNLWAVDNLSTYRLTELFYEQLSTGAPVDIALQKAKIEFMRSASGEGSLPYYWAAAILVGKSDPIQIQKPVPWGFYLRWSLIILLLAGAAGMAIYLKKEKIL